MGSNLKLVQQRKPQRGLEKLLIVCSVVIASTTALSGCLSAKGPAQAPQGSWELSSLTSSSEKPIPSAGALTITIAGNNISGFSGCNDFFSKINIDSEKISLAGPLQTTKMACKDGAMSEQETRYLKALEKISSWEVSGIELTLYGETVEIHFHKPK